VIRAHIANQQNPAPPPPVNQAIDPAMQQFLAAHMQLIQNLANTVQQMQAQQNQPPQPIPPHTSATQGQAKGIHEPSSSYVLSLV
jgi:hypothetical protein